jgi:hypothetical protein
MDQTVTLLATAVCLLGVALGLRFRVYVLLPAGVAILVLPAASQLISRKMAGWGVTGALALLLLLNLGFVCGLLLRAAAAQWNLRKVAGLFDRPARNSEPASQPENAGREVKSDVVGSRASMASRRLAKGVLPR